MSAFDGVHRTISACEHPPSIQICEDYLTGEGGLF